MKKKNREAQIQRVRNLIERWGAPLGLRWWSEITWCYHDGDDSSWQRDNGQVVVMITNARWEYLWAVVDVNLAAVAERTDDQLEQDVLHELMHILLAEYKECHGLHHLERTCTRLAQAFRWVREAGGRDGVVLGAGGAGGSVVLGDCERGDLAGDGAGAAGKRKRTRDSKKNPEFEEGGG